MKILSDFKCECGEITEELMDSSVKQIKCDCGKMATKIIGLPTVKLDGTNPDFPGAYEKWARKREKRFKAHARKEQE